MSRFGQTKPAETNTVQQSTGSQEPEKTLEDLDQQQVSELAAQANGGQPLETDVARASVTPMPSTDTLTSADDLLRQQEGQSATESEVQKAHQRLADALAAKAAEINKGQATAPSQQASLAQGNVISGALTTANGGALNLLNQLGQEYDHSAQATGERPAGYYTVHQGSVRGKDPKPVVATQIGGLYYYDPKRLDEVSKARLDKLVKAGMATYEGGSDDSQPTAE